VDRNQEMGILSRNNPDSIKEGLRKTHFIGQRQVFISRREGSERNAEL
jgi:hypothetical protein